MDEELKKYIMFENDNNTCWLDASVSLVAHNKTFKKIVENYSNSTYSKINEIIRSYDDAINALNGADCDAELNVSRAKEMLLELQANTLEYLKQFLKFKSGEPDSAFCALLNLIYQDKSNIKEQLNVSWTWKKHCTNCGKSSKTMIQKPIITLSKVHNFNPECPSSFYVCTCKSEQEMELSYKAVPPCLIFHFEKGAGTGTNFPTSFSIKGRKYKLTAIIILEKGTDSNVNHFYTLIRNPVDNCWLECNDLEKKCVSFSPTKPKFNLKDVFIYVFEAFDNLDKINNDEASIDPDQEVENVNVEIIDLSDENDSTNNPYASSKTEVTKSLKPVKDDGASKISKDSYSKVDLSVKELSIIGKEYKSVKRSSTQPVVRIPLPPGADPTNVDFQDAYEKYMKYINSKSQGTNNCSKIKNTNNSTNENSKNNFTNEKRKKINESDKNETSSVQNSKMSSNQQSLRTENEHSLYVSCQKVSATDIILPSKNSLDNHDTGYGSDNNLCKDQVVDQSKKSEVETTDNLEYKIKDASDCNAKGFSSYLNVMKELNKLIDSNVTCDVDNQQSAITVTNPKPPNNFLNDKQKNETNSKNLNFQNKVAIESAKEHEIERVEYSRLQNPNALAKNKKGNFTSSSNSDCITGKKVVKYEEPSSVKKPVHDNPIPNKISKGTSDNKEDEANTFKKRKNQKIELKSTESKDVSSNGKRRLETDNNSRKKKKRKIITDDQAAIPNQAIASVKELEKNIADYSGLKNTNDLAKNKKENFASSCNSDCVTEKKELKRTKYKYVSSNGKKRLETEDNSSEKKKGKIITNDQAASSSLAYEEITDNILRGTKRASNSAESIEKRVKISNMKKWSEKSNGNIVKEGENAYNKQNSESDERAKNGYFPIIEGYAREFLEIAVEDENKHFIHLDK